MSVCTQGLSSIAFSGDSFLTLSVSYPFFLHMSFLKILITALDKYI